MSSGRQTAAYPRPQSAAESARSPVTSPTERTARRPPRSKSGPTYEEDEDLEYDDEDDDDEYAHRRSSSSSQSQSNRGGRKRSASIPLSPPSVGSDDEYYQGERPIEVKSENVLGNWHFAPLLIAIVPPLGAVLGGGADAWSDAILLVIASFYLYQLLKVPHDIYHTARTRRVLNGDAEDDIVAPNGEPASREQKRERQAAAAELKRAEVFSLVALVASPVAGAWLLHWLMETFTDGNRYLNSFNIRLFMLASGIKPWMHALTLFRKRLLHLQEVVHYPSSRVESMNRRLGRMEADLSSLRKLVALKTDVSLLRDGIDAPLTQLSRTMRRYEKKEEHLRMSAEDKFGLVESRLEDLLREVAINAELIEEERRQRQKSVSLPYSIYQAIRHTLGQRSQESAHRELLYDAPRNLPLTTPLNLTAPPSENAKTPTSLSSKQGSTSSESLPGYSSPPRYPQQQPPIASSFVPPSVSSAHSPSWTEEGLAYWIFLPINIPRSVIRGALSFANSRVNETKDTGYVQGFASVTGVPVTANGQGDARQARIASPSVASASASSAKLRYPDVVPPRSKRRV